MLHFYPMCANFSTMCGIFYLASTDTGTRDHQFNVSSERHPAGILLILKVLGKMVSPAPGDRTLQLQSSRQAS